MILTDHGEATAPAPAPPQRAPRRRRAVLTAVLGFGIPLAVISGWWGISASLAGGTSLRFDAQPVRCEGTEVTVQPSSDDPEVMQTEVEVRPGMQCFVRVHVVNQGWSDVTVDSVVLPHLGAESGFPIEAQFVNPNAQVREDRDAGIARFPMPGGYPIAAGEDELLESAVTDRGEAERSGCVSSYVQAPLLEISVWGYHRTVQPPPEPIWWLEGTVAACDADPGT